MRIKLPVIAFAVCLSSLAQASPITYEYTAEVVSTGSATSFKCEDTESFTCRTTSGLWRGDKFTGSLTYRTDETTTDTWYWGKARYSDLDSATLTFDLNGGVEVPLSVAFVFDDAPYYETDAFEIAGDDGIHDTKLSFKSSSPSTIDSLAMPDDLSVFFDEYLIGAIGSLAIKGDLIDTGMTFSIKSLKVIPEPATWPLFLLCIPLLIRKRLSSLPKKQTKRIFK